MIPATHRQLEALYHYTGRENWSHLSMSEAGQLIRQCQQLIERKKYEAIQEQLHLQEGTSVD